MASSSEGTTKVAVAAVAGVAAGAALLAAANAYQKQRARHDDGVCLTAQDPRSKKGTAMSRWIKPVVMASPNLETMAKELRKRLGSEEFDESQGSTVYLEKFKSNDFNTKFNWTRVVGRKIIFLFDTVDQSRFFEQLALLQALQGFAVPDGEDKGTKWKTYVNHGTYSWGRAAHITVVLPWYRPCQMERTSRWHMGSDGKWTNSNPEGEWLDVPAALYMARLIATPGSVPPLPGPNNAMDGMPLNPLWRPPLELLFVELHEEVPVSRAVSDLGATIRMERFVPYFLEKFKGKAGYPGKNNMYILFPDHGAYDRYSQAVSDRLKLDADHILYIKKTRVGESIGQEQKLFYLENGTEKERTTKFAEKDSVLIIDDFTNSGSTLFGAVQLCQKNTAGGANINVSIFVSHLVATYDAEVVGSLKKKLQDLGPKCHFFTTNSIPLTTNLLKDHPQVTVVDIADFIADMCH